MIPEVKVNHWKWCEVQGNSPHERWEWCEVNEEVDVYTALWLEENQKIDFGKYIVNLGNTDWAKRYLSGYIDIVYFKGQLTEEGESILMSFLLGIQYDAKFENIDEKLYTNEND